MSSSFKSNTANLTSSDYTSITRSSSNYNYIKKRLNNDLFKNKKCINSGDGYIKVKTINLNNPNGKKLVNSRSFDLLYDLKKGFYSPKCHRQLSKSASIPTVFSDSQKNCCEKFVNEPNINSDLQFGLFYTNYNQNDEFNRESFKFSAPEHCCNGYKKNIKHEIITVESQFDRDNKKNWIYGNPNLDLFKFNFNSPIYFN